MNTVTIKCKAHTNMIFWTYFASRFRSIWSSMRDCQPTTISEEDWNKISELEGASTQVEKV